MNSTTEQTTMTRITYSKFFLTGVLTGISVRCGFDVPAEVAHERMMGLQGFTKQNPGRDFMTNDEYWIYNVGSEEVPEAR